MTNHIAKKIQTLIDLVKKDPEPFLSINTDEKVDLENDIVKLLNKIAGNKTSIRTIKSKLINYLFESKKNQTTVEPTKFIEDLIQFDNSDFNHTEILLPFSGASISSSLELFDFKIDKYTPELRNSIIDSAEKHIKAKFIDERERNSKESLGLEEYILKDGNFLILRFGAALDPEKIATQAQERLEILLKILNFAALISKRLTSTVVLLPGTSEINTRSNKIDISDVNIRFNASFLGSESIKIDDLFKENETYHLLLTILMEQIHSNNLKYPNNIISNSVTWASNANITFSLEAKVLSLIIAMESLVPIQKNTPISGYFAESIAFLIGKNVSERKKYYSYMKDLYNKRSALAHGSKTKIDTMDFDLILNIYIKMLNYIITNRNKLQKANDLLEIILNKKFGSNHDA